jgi:hypothetical protein
MRAVFHLVWSGLCAVSIPAQAADVFLIAKPQFSLRVADDGSYAVFGAATNNTMSRAALNQGEVYFSFTVLGQERAIQYLRERNQLPVFVVIYAGGVRRDTLEIGIKPENWRKNRSAVLSKFDQEGFFTWRTYMSTQQTAFESLELLVRDGNSNVVARETLNILP